jgi:hypothetical protein
MIKPASERLLANVLSGGIIMRAFLLWGLLALTAAVGLATAPTPITYQGQVTVGGTPATGVYDVQFTVYNQVTGGTLLGSTIVEDVPVTNGQFTAAPPIGNGSASSSP